METFFAPAKLNLFLHIVGRRADGYHLLQSVFRLLDYGDDVDVAVRADGAIRRLTPIAGVDEAQDLTLKAARLLQAESGTTLGADIAVRKRLPMGGGLGGGSSDAATVLLALNGLWNLNWPRPRLAELGLRLGADVPFFVGGSNAFVEGIGERLTPIELPPAWYVVLAPPVHVATAEIFALPELKRDRAAIRTQDYRPGFGVNDLQAPVAARYPAVAEHLSWLAGFGDARMTGSGACVFLEVPDAAGAQEIFARRPPGMAGFAARGLNNHPLLC